VDGHAQGAPPQLGRERVPQRQPRPVEAVVAQGPAQGADLGLGMAVPAGDRAAMGALGLGVTGPTGHRVAVLGPAGVDRLEAGGGEGHEQPPVGGDRLGQTLAAAQAGGDQMPGVAAVGLGAGRTHPAPAVAARLEQHPVGLVLGAFRPRALLPCAGRPAPRGRPAAPGGAVGGPPDLTLPAGECGRVGRRLRQLVGGGQVGRRGGLQGPDSGCSSHARTSLQ
jgi:hypothetical protein